MGFRDVAAALHHSTLEHNALDVTLGTFELAVSNADEAILSVVGLERLAADEPWRLYVRPRTGGELEVTCARISCNGLGVTGIGRAYKS